MDRSTRGPTPGACRTPSPTRTSGTTTPELAPTTELRQLQYAEDARLGVGKRSRVELAPEYVRRYTTEILDHVDLTALATALPAEGLAALLCVERDPEACHRSLIAARLADQHGFAIEHLRP